MASVAVCERKQITFDKIENLLLDILGNEDKPVDVHELFDLAEQKKPIFSHELKYALAHLLANQTINLDYEGQVTLRK